MVQFEHEPAMRSVLTGTNAKVQCTGLKRSLQQDCETFLMNTASKLGPHTQTSRGTCPDAGL